MFRSGHINLMIATSVAEEGMDIAAANCVVRFDSVLHTVSLVQSRGRAREAESAFVVLQDNPRKTTDHLVQAERLQGDVIKSLIDVCIGRGISYRRVYWACMLISVYFFIRFVSWPVPAWAHTGFLCKRLCGYSCMCFARTFAR